MNYYFNGEFIKEKCLKSFKEGVGYPKFVDSLDNELNHNHNLDKFICEQLFLTKYFKEEFYFNQEWDNKFNVQDLIDEIYYFKQTKEPDFQDLSQIEDEASISPLKHILYRAVAPLQQDTSQQLLTKVQKLAKSTINDDVPMEEEFVDFKNSSLQRNQDMFKYVLEKISNCKNTDQKQKKKYIFE